MAKLTLRKRSVTGQRAHVVSRWTRQRKQGQQFWATYAIRSDNVLLKNERWFSSFDGKPQSSGWKLLARRIDIATTEARLRELGFEKEVA